MHVEFLRSLVEALQKFEGKEEKSEEDIRNYRQAVGSLLNHLPKLFMAFDILWEVNRSTRAKGFEQLSRQFLLSAQERRVLNMRYGFTPGGEEYTLMEIGARLQISKERVQQIHARAFMKLEKSRQLHGKDVSLVVSRALPPRDPRKDEVYCA